MILGVMSTLPVAAQSTEAPSASTPTSLVSDAPAQSPPPVPAVTAPTAPAAPAASTPVYPPAGNVGAGLSASAATPAERSAPAYDARRRREYDGPPLLLGRRIAVGGYGGVSTVFTHMLDRNGAAVGFEGALLLAHRLSLGFAGYGFSRTPDGPAALDGTERKLGTGYGGFVARYAFLTNLPVYFSVGAIIGGGVVVLNDDIENDDWDDNHDRNEQSDGFFMVQPELAMHANLTRWMRVGVTGGYRITSNVSRFGLTESDLNGVVLGGNIQFGWI
jgi:hypothetical protein